MRYSAIRCISTFILTLLAVPLAAETQPAGQVYRLGILSPAAVPDPAVVTIPNLVPMALRELGYVEGGNLVIERRFAEGKLDRPTCPSSNRRHSSSWSTSRLPRPCTIQEVSNSDRIE